MFQSLLWWIAVVNQASWRRCRHHEAMFQSLLWWIGSRQPGRYDSVTASVEVSILVVVDCSRQPICVGILDRMLDVSILVVVDCSRQQRRHRSDSHGSAFQSLLWWIAVVNSDRAARPGDAHDRVSILVVVDCSRQPALHRSADIVVDVSILVVVDW